MKIFFNSLAFRMISPVMLIILLIGLALYLFVLRSVSTFAHSGMRNSVLEMSHDIYSFCDKTLNALSQTGSIHDEKTVQVNKERALGMIEEFGNQNDVLVSVIGDEGTLARSNNFPSGLSEIVETAVKAYEVAPVTYEQKNYYVSHLYFAPWKWHIFLVQDTHAYSLLVNKVNLAYGLTGLALFLVTTGILFSLGRTIRHPLRKIVEAMKKDELPRYKGIHEFEFLSDNISAVMESLRKETMMLNSIYHITASKKGEEFFDEVAAAISRLFHLNSLIARVNPDGKSEHVMALSRNGTIERGFDIELKGTPCENVIEKKHMCVFEEGAYREFPGATILREMNVESFIGFAIFDRKNEVIGVVNAFGEKRSFNESDIKVLQTIGQMVAAELERLAEEKEKEQMREQIFQTQKMEAIGTLAGGIAHDFNNLLQGIMGYASVLRTKVPESDPLFRPLSIIEHLSENAAELTKQLLGFARKGRFVVKPSNINDMVEEVLSIITRTFDRVIEIRPDLKKDLWTVEVDRSQVEQVILNLCLNARDAMPGGGVLTIETSNAEIEEKSSHYPWLKAGRYVTIRVSDTGMGMSDEIKQHIFEPFFTTKETGKGTGMGLAMVYGVVKNHGGFITADSEIGKGSLFTVYFPAVRRAIEIERKVVAELPRGEGTILVADDEDYIRNLVQNVLGSLGYTVLLASNGQEAVDLYRARGDSIDLVILDLIMPKMSGYEALQRLKAMNPGVRVLMSSGYGVEGKTGINLDQAGIAGFIQKPYSSNKIADAVMQVLSSG